MHLKTTLTLFACLMSTLVAPQGSAQAPPHHAPQPPNVILIMTDDQGYGDLGCHGNPVLKTPHLDRLHSDSVRFTDFHVSPLCTPTRAALMTGRYPARTGAYRTSAGRTLLHADERTIANVFADQGYATGMSGKWHLGDSAPHRPQDRGFQNAVWHRCGAIGQISDHWGNDYYDDVYERNGKLEQFEGYCTDVWFRESIDFIEAHQDQPFFLYLAPNAPHSPYVVSEEWSAPYKDAITWGGGAEFYGMIANIDHNVGLLRERLETLGLADNTIFIFMTDNGTANGAKFDSPDRTNKHNTEPVEGYNAGMRGKKASIYDGGHRVPFFIRWPAGGIVGGRDITSLGAHIDVLPTLAQLCGFDVPATHAADGVSLAPQLLNPAAQPARDHLISQFQGGIRFYGHPQPWKDSYIIQGPWRLINGEELYHIDNDPLQNNDLAAHHPKQVQQLRTLYPPFWESVSPRMTPVSIDVGNPDENPLELTCQDWYMPKGNPPWRFSMIEKLPRVTAPWHLTIKHAGRYRITLRQFPKDAKKPVVATRARIQLAGQTASCVVEPGSLGVVFELDLPAGQTELWTYLQDDTGEAGGAYFTEVEKL